MRWLSSVTTCMLVSSLACAACSNADADRAPSEPSAGDAGTAAGSARRPLARMWGAPTLVDENPDPDIVEVHLRAAKTRLALDGKEIDVLAYNGSVPGPILQARPGQRVIVHFENGLDEPTTVHWHGLRIGADMDGSPRIQTPVPAGGTFTYDFVVPEAASFWYHPHVETHAQLERGLYGAIVVQDDRDPVYDLERSLVLDDVLLDASGAIAPPSVDGLTGLSGRYGNVMLTNGKNAKLATASAKKGQVERWRLVNVANARTMTLRAEGARVRLVATDGGLLERPVDVGEELVLPVGGRLDLEVSYDRAGTARLVLAEKTGDTTMFSVTVADGPETPRAIAWPEVKPAVAERVATSRFDMSFAFVQQGPAEWTVNGQAHWMAPILTAKKGATVKMRLSNASGGVAHPFHLHGQLFRVVGSAAASWPGLRDTVLVPAMEPIEIVAYLDNPGRWMAHCHILEHAALGMMTEIEVTP